MEELVDAFRIAGHVDDDVFDGGITAGAAEVLTAAGLPVAVEEHDGFVAPCGR